MLVVDWGEQERKEAELIIPQNLLHSKGIFCKITIASVLLDLTMKGEYISNFDSQERKIGIWEILESPGRCN